MVILVPSIDAKVIGEYGQIVSDTSASFEGELLLKDFQYKPGLQGHNFFPMRTTPKAKLTDFLNSSFTTIPSQIIVSERLMRIFKLYQGQPFEIGNVVINHASQSLNYFLIGRTKRMTKEIIDFERSRVAHLNWRKQKHEPVACHTLEEFEGINDSVFVNISFHKEKILGLHHFISPFVNKLFISNEMAQAMIDAQVSGIELYEYNSNSNITQNELRNLNRIL